MNRDSMLSQLQDKDKIYDFVVIGGGATGLGVCLDAATRGYTVALFERSDFTKGTSSRSTKLVHGGVRYMAQGDLSLVREALHERGLLRHNAPHLVKDQRFLIPCYHWWEGPYYTCGLIFYDLLARYLSFGRSYCIGPKKVSKIIPTLQKNGLTAGVVYHDGQFDDSRLAINLATTAVEAGACVLNYMNVIDLLKEDEAVSGVKVCDEETGEIYLVKARCVINATGVFADEILQMDNPENLDMVRPSQGVHLVLDKSFLGSDYAIMIPKTPDGRVLFAVPWHDKVIIGTTDTLMEKPEIEPVALEKEIQFILDTAGKYLSRQPLRHDVLSVYAGLRPLAAPKKEGTKTKEISRSHKIFRNKSGLITIIGGKWTTYRRMAQDTLDYAIRYMHVPTRLCVTEDYAIHGANKYVEEALDNLSVYGADASEIRAMIAAEPRNSALIHPDYEYTRGEVVWIIRNEMPLTIEDVLARRLRILFVDARVAMEMAPEVANIMAEELGKDNKWKEEQLKSFRQVASNYILN